MSQLIPKLDRPVPIFPLPNLVMFPHAIQFLHMFEQRYRTMMDHVAREPEDQRFIATALLRPGYEAKYYTNFTDLFDAVCVGLVVRHERNADGTYNLILRGLCRATIVSEDTSGPYRVGRLEPFGDRIGSIAFDEGAAREQLARVLMESAFDADPRADSCRTWTQSDLPLSALIDLLSYHLLPETEIELKQLLLDQPDLAARHELLTGNLAALGRALDAARSRWKTWPPRDMAN